MSRKLAQWPGEEPGREAPDRCVYDPLDTRPAELYQKEIKNFITDQTNALNLFGNGVVCGSYGPAQRNCTLNWSICGSGMRARACRQMACNRKD